MHLDTADLVVRLLVAAACGAAVGVEREASARGAGARTHGLVALGAAAFTLAGAYGFIDIERSTSVDPARVAAQVAAGVGFIGAGAIIRHGTSVMGVTTAATVWLAASLGVAAAAGAAWVAAVTTVLALAILVVLRMAKPITQRLGRHTALVEIEYRRGHGTLGPLLRTIEQFDGRLRVIRVDDDDEAAVGEGLRRVLLQVAIRGQVALDELLSEVGRRPEVRHLRIGASEPG